VTAPRPAAGWRVVNPAELGRPSGFNHGMLAPGRGRLLLVAGQAPLGEGGRVVAGGFVAQFERALRNVVAVIREAGGEPAHLGRLTIYVKDVAAYRASRKALGGAWRAVLGRHYPAVALVQVADLVDEGALVEMEGTAVIPEGE
jgi:enamine deaminase RidA (YjgF/YER057c/UK114 family)